MTGGNILTTSTGAKGRGSSRPFEDLPLRSISFGFAALQNLLFFSLYPGDPIWTMIIVSSYVLNPPPRMRRLLRNEGAPVMADCLHGLLECGLSHGGSACEWVRHREEASGSTLRS
ncbi:hypothetical protein NL676_031516 [Syzygium grande]|nr:hypothetical protein NL676_031516 [Syzygium grande]